MRGCTNGWSELAQEIENLSCSRGVTKNFLNIKFATKNFLATIKSNENKIFYCVKNNVTQLQAAWNGMNERNNILIFF